MTGRHRGPKRKLRPGYRAPSRHRHAMCCHSYFCLLDIPGLCNAHHTFQRRAWYRALSLCCARAMRVFDVRHHPHPQATLVPNFVSVAPSNAELARKDKSPTQSLNDTVSRSPTHPAYLMCRKPKLSLRNTNTLTYGAA